MKLSQTLFAVLIRVCVATPTPVSLEENDHQLQARVEPPPPACQYQTFAVTSPTDKTPGDGDPHQNYYDIQVSDTILCDNGDCSAGETNSQSFTVGFSFGTNSNFKPTFFQAGFSVSETWTTGNTYTCDGTAGESVCIWQRVAHTAVSLMILRIWPRSRLRFSQYSLGQSQSGVCNPPASSDIAIMRSPNDNNLGGGFFCVRGAGCQSKGANSWENDGCAGGPQTYCGTGPGASM